MTTYTYDYSLAVNNAGDPQENIAFDFYADAAATTLLTVNDLNGTPLANLTSSSSGVIGRFQSTVSRGYLKSGSLILPILSVEAQDGAGAAASAQASADAASASATSAASVTTNLGANISSAISNDPTLLANIKGAKGDQGTAGLNVYDDWLNRGNTGTYADYQATLVGLKGDTGPSNTGYSPVWDITPTANYVTPWLHVPATAVNGIKITAAQLNTDAPTTTAATVQLQRAPSPGGTVTNLLAAGSEVTLGAGQSDVYTTLPSTTVPAGAVFRAKLITPPSTGSGTATADSSLVSSTGYGDGLTTTANSHPATLPTGGQVGDKVLVLIPEQSNNTKVVMSDGRFSEVKRTGSAATPQLSGLIFAADWVAGLDCTIRTFNSTDGVTPVLRSVVATVVIVRGSGVSFTQADLSSGGNNTGPTRTGPSVTETAAAGFVIAVEYFRLPADVVVTTAVTGGPTGATPLRSPQSGLVTTGVNVGMIVRLVPGVAAGGVVPGSTYTLTQTSGAGLVSGATHVSGYVAFPAGASVTGVSKMTAFLEFERI